jgi:phosphoribosylamine--glycine ligase
MKVLVIGSGGREHSIIWKLSQDKNISKIFCIGVNKGISDICETIDFKYENINDLKDKILELKPDLVVVGPEIPLSEGITNLLEENNILVFGPTKEAAKIESSKIFSKELMLKNNIPTAYAKFFNKFDDAKKYALKKGYENIVIKADGLARGKGVFLPKSDEDMINILKSLLIKKELGQSGINILIEDKIYGPEVSVFTFTDGDKISEPIAVCDYKRAYDNDEGLNSGGMGCYTPPEFWNEELKQTILNDIIYPTLKSMKNIGTPFKGILYSGIMITNDGPKVIEYNCRFGDPECELIMPMLNGNLSEIFLSISKSNFNNKLVSWKNIKGVSVVICSDGYPEEYKRGFEITGLENINKNIICFHSGTKELEGKLLTDGGRVIVLSNLDKTIKESRARIYKEINKVKFNGSFYRSDIALKAEEND